MRKRIALIALLLVNLQPLNRLMAQEDLSNIKFTVTEAPEWNKLFIRTLGWFGADGIYSIPLNGRKYQIADEKDKTLILFSDTMIGELENGRQKPGAVMVHNTVAVLEGKDPAVAQVSFYYKNKGDQPEAVFVPKTPQTGPTDYYWLGDGFVNQELDNSIFIFGYRVRNISDAVFGFSEVGNTLIKIRAGRIPPYHSYEQKDTPFYIDKSTGEMGSFGAGIYVNTIKAKAPAPDGYVYVYGVKGQSKKVLVARVRPVDFEDYSKWAFYDGVSWQTDMYKAAAITDQVSNELSVSPLPDGRYAMVFQHGGISRSVAMRIGASPVGPFGPVIKLFDTGKDLIEKGYYSYNAKAHPSLSENGELLISYNINSFDFLPDLNKNPQLYRPRFIKVKFQD